MENYYRILNVFIKSKNLEKLDSILLLSSTQTVNDKIQAKINALKTLINTKFTALRLWFQSTELLNETNCLINNEEEVKQIVNQEFVELINTWLTEGMQNFKSNASKSNSTGVEFTLGNQTLMNNNQIIGYVIIVLIKLLS